MVRRSMIIFAVSLAVLSTLEPAICFGAPAPVQNRDEIERPRFLKREIKRFYVNNSTTTRGPEGPGDGEPGIDQESTTTTSEFDTLADTLTTPEVAQETTTTTITDNTVSPAVSSSESATPIQSPATTSPPDNYKNYDLTQLSTTSVSTATNQLSSSSASQSTAPTSSVENDVLLPTITTSTDITGSSQPQVAGPSVIVPNVKPPLDNVPVEPTDTSSPSSSQSILSASHTSQSDNQGLPSVVLGPPLPGSSSSLIATSQTQPTETYESSEDDYQGQRTDTNSPASSTTTGATAVPSVGGNGNQSPFAQPTLPTVTPTNEAGAVLPSVIPPIAGNAPASTPVASPSSPGNVLPGAQTANINNPPTEGAPPPGVQTTDNNSPAGGAGTTSSNSQGAGVSTPPVKPVNDYTAPNDAVPTVPPGAQTTNINNPPTEGAPPPGVQTTDKDNSLAGGAGTTSSNSQGAGVSITPVKPVNDYTAPDDVVPTVGATLGAGLPGAQTTANAATTAPGSQATTKAGAVFSQNPEGPVPTGSALYNALTNALGPDVAPSSTMFPNGVVIPSPQEAPQGEGANLAPLTTLADGNIVSVPQPVASALSAVYSTPASASVTNSNGEFVAYPSAALATATHPNENPLTDAYVSYSSAALPVLTDTNGNPITSAFVPYPSAALPPIETETNGNPLANIFVPNPSAALPPTGTDTNGNLITSSFVPYPSAALPPTESDTNGNPITSSFVLYPSAALPVLTGTNENPISTSGPATLIPAASEVPLGPNPAAATNPGLAPFVPAVTNSNGYLVPNPVAATNTVLAPVIPSSVSVSLPIGSEVQNNALAAHPSTALPISAGQVVGSSTLSNGAVVPITAGQVTGSSTLSDGSLVPETASPTPASTTLPNGSVVPVSNVPAQASTTLPNGLVVPVSSAPVQASTTLPNGSVVPVSGAPAQSSTTLPNGSVVPLASVQQTSAPAITIQSPNAGGPEQSSTFAPAVQSFPTNAKGPFSQQPTGYNSATAQSVPTSILVQPPVSSMSGVASSSNGPTGLPTGVPLVLYPPTGPVQQPENTDMIQVGFNQKLNYDFVWTHDQSQKQIFKYLPQGIAYGLNIELSNVTMQTLRAWNTIEDLHYITTLALAFIPSGLVDTLSLLVETPTSQFYNNPDNSTNTLLSLINNALPINADNSTDGEGLPYGAMPTNSVTAKTNGAPIGGSIGSSAPVRASSVGIGVGVACGAAAYGAAMFFIARRYKKRRQSHLRSPSMYSSPVMSHIGPDAGAGAALMSGGVDRSISPYHDEDGRAGSRGSGRSGLSSGRQQISAPVMAENSLGWN